jgi:hypothetical protein
MNKPQEISRAEWDEIITIPEIREAWGLETDETVETFTSTTYGVKFNYMNGGPGYIGDLYLILGDG